MLSVISIISEILRLLMNYSYGSLNLFNIFYNSYVNKMLGKEAGKFDTIYYFIRNKEEENLTLRDNSSGVLIKI